MSITNTDKVDLLTYDGKEVSMLITDHFQWGGELPDDEHMYLLQEKINSYLRFYESGEIYEIKPEAKGKLIVVCVISKYILNEKGQWFFNKIKPIVESAGIELRFEKYIKS